MWPVEDHAGLEMVGLTQAALVAELAMGSCFDVVEAGIHVVA